MKLGGRPLVRLPASVRLTARTIPSFAASYPGSLPYRSANTNSGIDNEEFLAELPAKLAAVPAGAQVVLRLHCLQSMTLQEIAEVLEIPVGTVKSRLAYGLMCLRGTGDAGCRDFPGAAYVATMQANQRSFS
jgi:RNA polymerase sigma factor (sigma-70 family)